MKNFFNSFIRPRIKKLGIDVIRFPPNLPEDYNNLTGRIFHMVKDYTITSSERVNALVESVKYIIANNIQGDFVECGVWRGGSAMAMALTLKELHDESRDLYLYDTFAGMTSPTDVDVDYSNVPAAKKFAVTKLSDESSNWVMAPLAEVKKNIFSTGYPTEKFHFIEGMVEKTIPAHIPPKIALLRLDTDWYKSTKHELVHLFPRLSPSGVLIVDDYGHWKGCRQAVDEYIEANGVCMLLNRIDYTCRVGIKID